MRHQSFYQLSRIIQDRYIAAADAQTLPSPILSAAASTVRWNRFWLSLALAGLAGLVLTLCLGYGSLVHPLSTSPPAMAWLYAALLLITGLSLQLAYFQWHALHYAPFPRGRFLFPSGVIDSGSANFRILPIAELEKVELGNGSEICLVFVGNVREYFTTQSPEAAHAVREGILAAREEWLEKQHSSSELTLLDPLLEPRYSNPLSSRQPRQAPQPWGTRFLGPFGAYLLLAALTLPAGFGLRNVRNVLSERKMYARAVAENTVESYQAFLAKNEQPRDVAAVLLPRAQFTQLLTGNSVAPLEKFLAESTSLSIRPEVEERLKERLLSELQSLQDADSLSSLDAFANQHSTSVYLVRKQWLAARQALVQRALQRFIPRAASTAGLIPFMEATLEYVAKSGPNFEVRFQRVIPPSSIRADETVRADPEALQTQVPSQYFDAARIEPWRERIYQHLVHSFGLAFRPDVLRITQAEWLPSNTELPSYGGPGLFISYSANMGSGIRNQNPNGTFFGVGIQVRARLVHPHAEPVEMRFAFWSPPDLLRLRQGKLSTAQVYEAMANAAFQAFEKRLVAWIFKRDANPPKQ
jgi:hypothetical protein